MKKRTVTPIDKKQKEKTSRGKVGEGAIRKKIASKPKIAEQRHKRKSRTKKYDRGEKYKNGKYLQCITGGRSGTNIRRRTSPITKRDKEEKKVIKVRGRGRLGKYLNEK